MATEGVGWDLCTVSANKSCKWQIKRLQIIWSFYSHYTSTQKHKGKYKQIFLEIEQGTQGKHRYSPPSHNCLFRLHILSIGFMEIMKKWDEFINKSINLSIQPIF